MSILQGVEARLGTRLPGTGSHALCRWGNQPYRVTLPRSPSHRAALRPWSGLCLCQFTSSSRCSLVCAITTPRSGSQCRGQWHQAASFYVILVILTVHADASAVPVKIANLALKRGCVDAMSQAPSVLRGASWLPCCPRLPDTPRSCAGSRQLLAAQVAPAGAPAVDAAALAPGPAAPAPPADVLFTLTAPSAELNSDTLVLRDVAPVVQSFTRKAQTGVYRTGATNSPADSQLSCVASLLAARRTSPHSGRVVVGLCMTKNRQSTQESCRGS